MCGSRAIGRQRISTCSMQCVRRPSLAIRVGITRSVTGDRYVVDPSLRPTIVFVPIRFHRYPVCSHACFWQNPSHESSRSGDRFTSRVRESARVRERARSLSLMCWDMNFPEDWLCSMTVMAPNVVGATCLTKFRPIAGLCAMRKVLGCQVTLSTEIRERTNCGCAEDACRCWSVSAAESCRIVERVAERNCGSTIGRDESVRPCGPSSGRQGNEATRCELVLDGFGCCNLEWKLYESAPGDGLVEQSSDEPRHSPTERRSL